MEWWMLGLGANGVIALAYFGIAATIFFGIARSRQWLQNPLALATGMIFLSCGVGHGVHFVHGLAVWSPTELAAQRLLFGEWHVWLVDGITALIAVWYFTLRGRFPALVRGAALFEDMRVRQRQALEIHDNIVQGIVKAKLSAELGEMEATKRELDSTLLASRNIMSELLGEAGKTRPIRPGELARGSPGPGGP
jgi:hypothetical protein